MPKIEDAVQNTVKDPNALQIQIEQKSTQADPTRNLPIEFNLVFSKKVKSSSFDVSKIINSGTATGVVWQVTEQVDRTEYLLSAISVASNGTVIPFIADSSIEDMFGISNNASASADASVTYDTIRPSLSINQNSIQSDPANAFNIRFDIVFSEAIDATSFTAADILQNGTATGVTWSIADSGDHKNFLLSATAASTNGTIVPSVPINLVADLAGNLNTVSTSTDNTVVYDSTAPTLTINQAGSQVDPAASLPIEFDVVFSEAIAAASFTVADITNSGTASVLLWNIVPVDSLNYIIRAASLAGDGTVIPSIAIGRITDLAGNANTLASTSTDNSVTYDTTPPLAPTIAGVTGTGDAVQNNLLSGGAGNDIATIHWADVSGETEYKIAIYENDGSTIKCAEASKAANSTSHTFSGCGLTQGKAYKVQLTANDNAANSVNATNNMYAFLYAPEITIADTTQDENHVSGKIIFTVSLNVASDWATSLDYATANNTALMAGMFNDYIAASGTLIIAAGNTTGSIEVSLIDGAYDEPDSQDFYVNLSSVSNAKLNDTQAVGTINDNDDPPTITVAAAENYEAGPSIDFISTLSLESEKTIQYSWATIDGTGGAGVDFVGGTGGPVTIAAGSNTSTVNIASIDNTMACQIDRDFNFSINTFSNVTAGATISVTGLVKEDDFPQILLSESIVTEGGKAQVKADLSTVCPTKDITVNWTVASSRALLGSDLAAQSGSFIIRKNEMSSTISVSTNDDSEAEAEEDFIVSSVGKAGELSLKGSNVRIILQDNDGGGSEMKIIKVAIGSEHKCALLSNGKVKCWGRRTSGRLADGAESIGFKATDLGDNLSPINLGTGLGVLDVSLQGNGDNNRCAVLSNKKMKCWGVASYYYETLHNSAFATDSINDLGDNLIFADIGTVDIESVRMIDGGGCILTDDGKVKCWGSANSFGQQGYGDTIARGQTFRGNSIGFVDLGTGRTATKIETGRFHICAILDNERLKCWGDSTNGKLGYGNLNHIGDQAGEMGDALAYVDLGSDAGNPVKVKDIDLGENHTCAIVEIASENKLKCWGSNTYWQLNSASTNNIGDDPSEMGDALPAIDFGPGLQVTKVFAGALSTCATFNDNSSRCWGSNFSGSLALGMSGTIGDIAGERGQNTPILDPGLGRHVIDIALYYNHACYLLDNNTVKCAGTNDYGQLGVGSTLLDYGGTGGQTLAYASAVSIGSGLSVLKLESSVTGVSSSSYRSRSSCFILNNASLKCVGATRYGAIPYNENFGDHPGEMGDQLAFAQLGDDFYAIDVVATHSASCALSKEQKVKCWGYGYDGQMFQGSSSSAGEHLTKTGNNLAYLDFGTGKKVKSLFGEYNSFCAIFTDDTSTCWGTQQNAAFAIAVNGNRGDSSSEIGNNTLFSNYGSNRHSIAFSGGYAFMCALLDNTDLKCIGQNDFGQLGQEDIIYRGATLATIGDNVKAINFGTENSIKLYAKQITSTYGSTCALLNNDKVKCWGLNYSGQLGYGHTNVIGDAPNEMGNNLPYVDLGSNLIPIKLVSNSRLGGSHSLTGGVNCALFSNGKVKCWGGGAYMNESMPGGRTYGDQANEMGDNLPFINLGSSLVVKDLFGSYNSFCAIFTDDRLKCWGYNDSGSLGIGHTTNMGNIMSGMGDSLPFVDLGTNTPPIGNFAISGIIGGTDVDADGVLAGSIANVLWSAASGATQYKVTIYQSDKTTVMCAQDIAFGTSYSFAGCNLSDAQIYYAKLVAEDGIGNSREASNSMFGFVVDTQAPDSFNILGISYGLDTNIDALLTDGLKLSLHWQKSETAFAYEVQIFENDGTTVKCPLVQLDSSHLQYYFSNCELSDLGIYRAQVVAKDAANNQTAASNSLFSFTVNETSAPQNFSITGITGGSDTTVDAVLNNGTWANVHWTDAEGENYYTVAIYENDGTTIKCAAVNVAKDTTVYSFNNCQLDDLATYKLRIVAVDTFATSPASNNFYDFAVNQNGSSGSFFISGIRSTDGLDVNDDNILSSGNFARATWLASAGALSYNVSIWTSDLSSNICGTKNTVSTSYDFTDCNLSGNRTYKLKVVAQGSSSSTEAQNSPFDFSLGDYPSISINNPSVSESAGTITFTVSLNKVWTADVTANYMITNLEASAGLDYQRSAGLVTIAAGNMTANIVINILDDSIAEFDERFILSLYNVNNAKTSKASIGIGTILASDGISGIAKVVTSKNASCKLDLNGEVKCWGLRLRGMLGIENWSVGDEPGEMGDNLQSVALPAGRHAIDIAQNIGVTCVLLDNKRVTCWGANTFAALGYSTVGNHIGLLSSEMGNGLVQLNFGEDVEDIDGFFTHMCARTTSGRVQCWGDGNYGALGRGNTSNSHVGVAASDFVDLGTGKTAKQISVGHHFACVILNDDSVKCWGYGFFGRLGNESSLSIGSAGGQMGDALLPVNLGTGRTAKKIATGHSNACAIFDNNKLKCWGFNEYGNLGLGDNLNKGNEINEMGDNLPYGDLGTGYSAKDIFVGSYIMCAVLSNDRAKCWGGVSGSGLRGSLGRHDVNIGDNAIEMGDNLPYIDFGSTASVPKTIKSMNLGFRITCALLNDDSYKCIGSGEYGLSGQGHTNNLGDNSISLGNNLPEVNLGTGLYAKSLSRIGLSRHHCVILNDNSVKCFGADFYLASSSTQGALGSGRSNVGADSASEMLNLEKVKFPSGLTAKNLFSSSEGFCAILSDDSVRCYGDVDNDSWGPANNSHSTSSLLGDNLPKVPILTPDKKVLKVVSSEGIACYLYNSFELKCAGGVNNIGLNGDTRASSTNDFWMNSELVNVGTDRSVINVAVALSNICAILDDFSVKCWGGPSSTGNPIVYQPGLGNIGDNFGEMGDGLPTINLGTGVKAVDIGASADSVCILAQNSRLKCWGSNASGQTGYSVTSGAIGDAANELGDSLGYLADFGLEILEIVNSSGYSNFYCALAKNASNIETYCWGRNQLGQLGLGTSSNVANISSKVDLGTALYPVQISASNDTVCSLLNDQSVKCWGNNNFGKLGLGDINHRGDVGGEMGDNLPAIGF